MTCCIEVVRAHVASRYGRRTIENAIADGYSPVSDIDPVYGSQWMARPACDCKSSEECAVLRDLGMACETHGCGGAA